MKMENTSGQGELAIIPDEIKKWNWGAFWFSSIWGLFNRSYIALLALIPIFNFIVPFYLGAKGNELAWRNRSWESTEAFWDEQRVWSIGGWIIAILIILSIGNRFVSINRTENITANITTQVLSIISENKEASKIIGEKYSILLQPALQSVTTSQGTFPTAHIIFIDAGSGMILVHTSLDKNYTIKQITISPPDNGEKITISVTDK
jgi:hypothetical protein